MAQNGDGLPERKKHTEEPKQTYEVQQTDRTARHKKVVRDRRKDRSRKIHDDIIFRERGGRWGGAKIE